MTNLQTVILLFGPARRNTVRETFEIDASAITIFFTCTLYAWNHNKIEFQFKMEKVFFLLLYPFGA